MNGLLLLVMGIAGLWIGAESVVQGSTNIARYLKMSPLLIGLSIVSIGTSIPEIAVSVMGGIGRLSGIETSGIVVGNTIGSCLTLLTLLIGIIGLFGTLLITKRELMRDGMMLLGAIALFFVVAIDGHITKLEGAIMLIIYIVYFVNLFREEKQREKRRKEMHIFSDIVALIAGLVIVIVASKMVVNNGIILSELWGIKESLVGILFIGLGTGLPELAVSLSAIRRKTVGLAVGNMIGSNICDLMFALGLGSVISGFVVSRNLLKFDIPFLFGAAILTLVLFRSKLRLKRKEAVLLILVYCVYAGLKFMGL
ncbi:calcium/sodium antiporter [Candidatus Woesearchaeota archaeon]|nr:calcium/sodium antiporter [Candidatus Woesearchaeota archaeon]